MITDRKYSSAAPFISVVVLNWNGAKVLPRCLEALASQTFTNFDILIWDNASTDGSIEVVEENFPAGKKYPGLKVIRSKENLGFSVSNNRAVTQAQGRWVFILNNDAFPAPDCLEKLVQATRGHPECSFFATRLLMPTKIIDGTGDVYHVSGCAWHRDRNLPVEQGTIQPGEVFSACAAAALYDRQKFIDAGGFNERYFSYYEDVDLGFRLRLRGERCWYVPDAIIEHIGSASFGLESDAAVKNAHRNLVWVFFANMPTPLLWKYLPAHLISNLVFLLYYTLRGQARAIWSAKWQALCGLRKTLQERQIIQSNRRITTEQLSQRMDHELLGPYLLGKRGRAFRKY